MSKKVYVGVWILLNSKEHDSPARGLGGSQSSKHKGPATCTYYCHDSVERETKEQMLALFYLDYREGGVKTRRSGTGMGNSIGSVGNT